ncbi:hypothetical protein Q4E93_32350 [Flavitalea sp. BT771]|uniref:hypothetical protein n=1 Tax=Flavitalea sp. BT771 TaxID=3063329 RepID=UPI0026E2663A|nr:hypothetical protein [Flavitalea sp. BT771]MDO6435352.1 hypothetical protein [Flavitalea sp. BT771]MDV6224288.1 hypothetical protein [Flavitalea sp. BT771]
MSNKSPKKAGKVSKGATDTIDYSKDPFFVKKNKKAAETIRKYGIPDSLLKGKQTN